jgi:hypothetical protein
MVQMRFKEWLSQHDEGFFDKLAAGVKGVVKGGLHAITGPEIGIDSDNLHATMNAIAPVAKDLITGNTKHKRFGPRRVRSPLLHVKITP